MSTQGQQSQAASPIYRIERIIASLVMAWVIILTTYMIFQDHALSQASMYFLKIILSLSGAVMLATLPGFMDVNYTVGGFSVRAAGGAAAFVFIYTQSPNLPAFKLDPAQAKPAQHAPQAKPDNLSQLSNGLPALMAFSLVYPGLTSSSAHWNETAQSGSFDAAVNVESAAEAASAVDAAGGISLGEAVSTDARAVLAAAARYAQGAAHQMLALLDRAAAALRSGARGIAVALSNILRAGPPGGTARETIALITESLSARADNLVSGLIGPGTAPVGGLLDQAGTLTAGLLGGLQNSADGIVSTTDHSVQALTSGLQGTVNTVTGALEKTTGGLTAGLTPIADRVVGGLVSTTGRLVDGVTPVVANTTSRVLDGVGGGVSTLTKQLNAISPALISKIDADFAPGQMRLQLPDRLEPTGSLPFLDKVAGLGKIGGDDPHGLLSGVRERNLLGSKFADPLGGEALRGPTCIGGCAGTSLSGPAPQESAGAIGTGQGRLLGPLGGGGAASSNPALTGTAGGHEPQGPISSVTGATSSILGGATRLIGRH